MICIAPLVDRSRAQVIQGELAGKARLRGLFLLRRAYLLRALCNICLNKLTTLLLRDIPPLKPFERRDQSTDIHDDMGRTQDPPLLTSSQYTRNIRFTRNIRLYRDISFDMHRSPCRPKQSAGLTGGAGRSFARTEGVLHRSPCLQNWTAGGTGRRCVALRAGL